MIEFFIRTFRTLLTFLYVLILIAGGICGFFIGANPYGYGGGIWVVLGIVAGALVDLLILTPVALLFETYTKLSNIESLVSKKLITNTKFNEMYEKISSIESVVSSSLKNKAPNANTEEHNSDTASSVDISL